MHGRGGDTKGRRIATLKEPPVTTAILPAPGLHLAVPFADYRAWPAMNHHTLNAGPTPAHVKHAIDNPGDGDTAALLMGRALHMALLEPARFAAEVIESPKFDRRSKAGREEAAAFEAEHAGKTIVEAGELDTVRGMADGVRQHPGCRMLLEAAGPVEASILWRDQPTGVLCKSRPDKVLTDHGLVLDIKTTRNAAPWAFSSAIKSYGYHRQLAMQIDGANASGHAITGAVFVVVENTAPYTAAAYSLEPASIECGRIEYRRALEDWAEAVASGEYRGFPSTIDPIGVPAWALRSVGFSLEGDHL